MGYPQTSGSQLVQGQHEPDLPRPGTIPSIHVRYGSLSMLIDNSSVCDQDHLEIVDIFLTKFMTVCFNGRQNIFFSIFQSRRREDRVILTKKIFFEIFIIFRNEARVGVINFWNKSSHGGLVAECLLDNLHALLRWVRISV